MAKVQQPWIRSRNPGPELYAADTVLFLIEAPERQTLPPARAVDLIIAKNRHGDVGKVPLIFRPDLSGMREEAKP